MKQRLLEVVIYLRFYIQTAIFSVFI